MKITVANTKGGVSKTTTTIMLATVLSHHGKSVEVWDADPQGGASFWAMNAEESGHPLQFEVIPVNKVTVKRPVPPALDIVLVDTAPGSADIAQAAVESSTMVVIPTLASTEDIARTLVTLEVAEAIGCDAHVFISQAEPHTRAFKATVAELKDKDVPLLEQVVSKAVGIKDEMKRAPEKTWGYELIAAELGLLG